MGCDEPVCEGGVIVDGVCEGKCTPDKCVESNVCVGNRCMLQCSSHNDCYAPYRGGPELQVCAPVQTDSATGLNDGDTVLVCTASDKVQELLTPCPSGSECDDATATDDWTCPDGTPCTEGAGSDHCSAAECRPLVCVVAGEGDSDRYCSTFDCTSDADCGPGMFCTVESLDTKICGTDKGTAEPCLDRADFKKDGATFQEGPTALMRNVCKKREPCASCEEAVDCSIDIELGCVELATGSACLRVCTGDADDLCRNDEACENGFCVPRSGTCTPPATDNFCHSCTNDLQCGDASSTVACIATSGGQRACFDTSFPDVCETDEDCPASPSGKRGACLDEAEGFAPGSDLYHKCYFPFSQTLGDFDCWKD
ncbi:MAG: hypothetical protein HOW73_37760 [Polyangiaceae bacterium]|nr:hypothetical protein [Polyangiaceae bacterium]